MGDRDHRSSDHRHKSRKRRRSGSTEERTGEQLPSKKELLDRLSALEKLVKKGKYDKIHPKNPESRDRSRGEQQSRESSKVPSRSQMNRDNLPDRSNSSSPHSPVIELTHRDEDELDFEQLEGESYPQLPEKWAECFGDDPNKDQPVEFQIQSEIANRWTHIIGQGLEPEVLKSLTRQYPPPSNCAQLTSPVLNLDVRAVLLPANLQRDRNLVQIQSQVATATTALGNSITELIKETNPSQEAIIHLGNAGKLLTDLIHTISTQRKNFIVPILNKSAQEVSKQTVTDTFLFGKDFGELCKAAKATEKSAQDIKVVKPPNRGYTTSKQSYSATAHHRNYTKPSLNRPGPSYSKREPSGQKGQLPSRKTTYRYNNRTNRR